MKGTRVVLAAAAGLSIVGAAFATPASASQASGPVSASAEATMKAPGYPCGFTPHFPMAPGGSFDMYNNCSNFGAYIHVVPYHGDQYDECVGPNAMKVWPGYWVQTAYTKATC